MRIFKQNKINSFFINNKDIDDQVIIDMFNVKNKSIEQSSYDESLEIILFDIASQRPAIIKNCLLNFINNDFKNSGQLKSISRILDWIYADASNYNKLALDQINEFLVEIINGEIDAFKNIEIFNLSKLVPHLLLLSDDLIQKSVKRYLLEYKKLYGTERMEGIISDTIYVFSTGEHLINSKGVDNIYKMANDRRFKQAILDASLSFYSKDSSDNLAFTLYVIESSSNIDENFLEVLKDHLKACEQITPNDDDYYTGSLNAPNSEYILAFIEKKQLTKIIKNKNSEKAKKKF